MKKLLAIILVTLVAVSAQAGTATWSASSIKALNGTDALANAVAYLFVGTPDAATITQSIQSGTFTGTDALYSMNTSSTGGIYKTGLGSFASETVEMYMVLFDNATIASSDHFKVTSSVSQTFGATGNKTFNLSTPVANAQWSDIAPVPEPTSGLLLLLGMAGLALKRKQA